MKAIITGCNGQDGSYLSEFLLNKGYTVIGITRRKSIPTNENIKQILDHKQFKLVSGDVTDSSFINRIVLEHKPDELYNLAAMSFVKESWNTPSQTFQINAIGTLNCLEAIRNHSTKTKFYNAASSEMYGNSENETISESTPPYPKSPYGVSKVAAYWLTINYRESFNLFACNGICFNHESERRGIEFVTRKISDGVVRIKLGLVKELKLGNLDSKRDWGYAPDYCEAMWLMLQQDEPEDFVIATDETHSIKEFLDEAFKVVGITNWKKYVKTDKKYMRPAEIKVLKGDYIRAQTFLEWNPRVRFKELVRIMVKSDLKKLGDKK